MNKHQLLEWLQAEHQQWQDLLNQIDPAQMDQAGVTDQWSFKDLIAHLTPDGLRCIANLRAILANDPQPPPPWPAHLHTDDAINAWLYETNRSRSVQQILDESQQMFQELFAVVGALPEDVTIEIVTQNHRSTYYLLLGDHRIRPGEIFDHYHDDHEQDVRAWLARRQ